MFVVFVDVVVMIDVGVDVGVDVEVDVVADLAQDANKVATITKVLKPNQTSLFFNFASFRANIHKIMS